MAPSTPSHLPSSSSSALAKHYNVFLSFRGPDTRLDFTDCLYMELIHTATPHVFRDKEEIRGGEEINPTLIEAIERSDISIPIISPRYAESKACLVELAHMSLCRKTKGHKVIPIFYRTQPNILEGFPRALEDKLGKSSKLGKKFVKYMEDWKVAFSAWKEALSDLAEHREKYHSLTKVITRSSSIDQGGSAMRDSGLTRKPHKFMNIFNPTINRSSNDCRTMQNSEQTWERPWSELFSEVVKDVKAHLGRNDLVVTDKLVDSGHHVKEMMRKLGVVCHAGRAVELVCRKEIRVVIITGMRGIGKTTLAKVVYNKIQHLFDSCSCLENIHALLQPPENSNQGESLQQKLISDLNERDYPKCNYNVAINDLRSMFQNTKVLIILDDVHDIKEVEGLAAKCDWFGPGSRIILTSHIKLEKTGLIEKAQEHVVEEMGDDFAIKLFRKHAYGQIPPQPYPRYESLAKQIVRVVKGIPSAIENEGGFLFGKSIHMWEHRLRELKERPHVPLINSFEESYKLLHDNRWHDNIQQIFLDVACFFAGTDRRVYEYMWLPCKFPADDAIKRLCNMFWVKIKDNNELWMRDQLQVFGKEKVKQERPEVRMRSRLWDHKEAKDTLELNQGKERVRALGLGLNCEDHDISLTNANFAWLPNLVFLKLDKTVIEDFSKGTWWWSTWLFRRPEKPLLRLIWLQWQGCSNSEGLSFVNLKELVILDLSGSQINQEWDGWEQIKKAEKLKVLKLTGCDWLGKFPDLGDKMNLEMLILDRCKILCNIDSINKLKKLRSLNLKSCKLVGSLPDLRQTSALEELLVDETGIANFDVIISNFHLEVSLLDSLKELKILSARDCEMLGSLTFSDNKLQCLTKLVLDGAIAIEGFPDSIMSLKNLEVLSMRGCWRIKSLPDKDNGDIGSMGNLQSLEILDLSQTSIDRLPSSVGNLKNLKVLKMRWTPLKSLPDEVLSLDKLEVMDLRDCSNLEQIPSDIEKLSSLRVLGLSSATKISSLPAGITKLFHLQYLELCDCPELQDWFIPESLNGKVTRCPLAVGNHRDHEEFQRFEHSFS